MVQRREGVRLHHPRGRLEGLVRPPLGHRRRGLQVPLGGREGRVRGDRGAEGPPGDERPRDRVGSPAERDSREAPETGPLSWSGAGSHLTVAYVCH